jgi:hypothetical protein
MMVLSQLQHGDIVCINTCVLRVLFVPMPGVVPKRHDIILIQSLNPIALANSNHMHARNVINLRDATGAAAKVGFFLGNNWYMASVCNWEYMLPSPLVSSSR